MVEYRTQVEGGPTKSDGDESSISLDDFVNQAISNLQGNRDTQMVLASALEDNGIDPRILTIFSPDLAKLMKKAQEQKEQQQKEQAEQEADSPSNKSAEQIKKEIDNMSEESEEMEDEVAKSKAVTTDDLLKFIEELSAILPKGEDTTLGDLEELGEENPQIVQNAIDSRLN